MRTKIKFCGLSTAEAVDLAAELGAWKAGFIFFARSPRFVSLEKAADLAARARRLGLETVAVSVDMPEDGLDRIVSDMKPDMLQFHGAETPEAVSAAKIRYGLPVMKALAIRDAGDLDHAITYADAADLLLFDAKPPKGAVLPGGNGVRFDWSLLEKLDRKRAYVLSGGLAADNVAEALAATRADMLDISSGIESAPGVKDLQKMRDFAGVVARFDAAMMNS